MIKSLNFLKEEVRHFSTSFSKNQYTEPEIVTFVMIITTDNNQYLSSKYSNLSTISRYYTLSNISPKLIFYLYKCIK